MTRTHYDTLGIPRDADAATVKRAYRRKSRAAHPDKGGDHREMVAINRAYDTLADPQKRARYDQTGEDGPPGKSTEEQARDALMRVFLAIVEKAGDYDDVMLKVGIALDENLARIRASIKQSEDRVGKLKRSAKRLKCKSGRENFLGALLEDQISNVQGALGNMHEGVAVVECAKEMLAEFTWEADKRPESVIRGATFTIDLNDAFRTAMEGAMEELMRQAGSAAP